MNTKATHIHGSPIVAALKADLVHNGIVKDATRVWCEDRSLHLVTGYEYVGPIGPRFDTIIGYWEIPEGSCYLSKDVREVITRPTFVEYL